MKLRNETKIGLLAVICIAGLIWGYNFLKGRNLLTSARFYTAEYKDVDFLNESSPVILNGMQVGVVVDMYYKDPENMDMISVEMSIESEYLIPPNTVAVIVDQGFMGGKAIELRTNIPCTSDFPCPQEKNQLRSQTQSFLSSVVGSPTEVDQYLKKVQKNLGPIIDTLENELKGDPEAEGLRRTMYDLAQTARHLNEVTGSLSVLLSRSSSSFVSMAQNLDSITGNISRNEENISRLLNSTAELTTNLKDLPLDTTINATNEMLNELQVTLQESQDAFGRLNSLLAKIDEGEGSLGKLFNDDSFLNQLSDMTTAIDTLAEDFRQRPYRYMPLKTRSGVLKKDHKDAKAKEKAQEEKE